MSQSRHQYQPNNSPIAQAPSRARVQSIPSGAAGTLATLKLMRGIVRKAKTNLLIRETALAIVQRLPEKRWKLEINAVFRFVRDRIRYVGDIQGLETIATPMKTLEYGQGDCDDKCVLLASLLIAINHPARFIALAFHGQAFSHVLVETRLGGNWIPLESTERYAMGRGPGKPTNRMVVHI